MAEQQAPELLPCPFCGALPEIGYSIGTDYIICVNEQCAIGPSAEEYTRGNVIAAWNRRAAIARAESRTPDSEGAV